MRNPLFIALILLQSIGAQAQYDDLLRNPHISWVAEYTTDFLMNPALEGYGSDTFNLLYPIQLHNNHAVSGLVGNTYCQQFMSELIHQNAGRASFQAYSDSTTQDVLSAKALDARVVKVDTGTYEPEYFQDNVPDYYIVRTEWLAEDISAVRVRQVFWYDSKRRRFGSRILAYAPVFEVKDPEGNRLNRRQPYFWLKGEPKAPKRRKTRDFAYVFQTKMAKNAPGPEDFKVIKGSLDFKQLVAGEILAPSYPCLAPSIYDHKLLDTAALAAICFGIDTTERFIGQTDAVETIIQPWNRISEINKIRFVQNWYYDEDRNRFYNRLVGWSPMTPVRNDDGTLRYQRALFYQMYER